MNSVYGMAVLAVRLLFFYLAYAVVYQIDWNRLMKKSGLPYAHTLCILVSMALGYMAGSFVISIIELIRDVLYSIFLT